MNLSTLNNLIHNKLNPVQPYNIQCFARKDISAAYHPYATSVINSQCSQHKQWQVQDYYKVKQNICF